MLLLVQKRSNVVRLEDVSDIFVLYTEEGKNEASLIGGCRALIVFKETFRPCKLRGHVVTLSRC